MRYLFALISEESNWQESPEAVDMSAWQAFGEEVVASGKFVAGDALEASATASTVRIDAGDTREVTDGPFAETKEQLGGYYVLECEDMDEALEWARKIPLGEGAIEVRPVHDFGGALEATGAAGQSEVAR